MSIVVLSCKLVLVWSGFSETAIIQDDAFYYFTIARNVALGEGPTFDGVAPTNGFHPLWLLFLVPLRNQRKGGTPAPPYLGSFDLRRPHPLPPPANVQRRVDPGSQPAAPRINFLVPCSPDSLLDPLLQLSLRTSVGWNSGLGIAA